MSTFSQCSSVNGKFHLKLEYSEENKPSKMLAETVVPRNESVSVYDLAYAIYNCFEGGHTSFGLSSSNIDLPCEVKDGLRSQHIQISNFCSFGEMLRNIALQMSI